MGLRWGTWYPLSSGFPLSVQNWCSLDQKVYLILWALASPGCSATQRTPCPGESFPFPWGPETEAKPSPSQGFSLTLFCMTWSPHQSLCTYRGSPSLQFLRSVLLKGWRGAASRTSPCCIGISVLPCLVAAGESVAAGYWVCQIMEKESFWSSFTFPASFHLKVSPSFF